MPPKTTKNYIHKKERRLDGRTFASYAKKGAVRWYRCKVPQCFAKAYTLDNGKILQRGAFGHAAHCIPDGRDLEVDMSYWMHKKLDARYWEVSELYKLACKKFDIHDYRELHDSIMSHLRSWRLKVIPLAPRTVQGFGEQLHQELYSYVLQYDSDAVTAAHVKDADGYSHVLFYDVDLVQQYCQVVSHLLVDIMFRYRPNITDCCRLLNVLGVVEGEVVNLFHAVMSSKTKAAYAAIFEHMKQVHNFKTLQVVMCDYDRDVRGSIGQVFPHAVIASCNYHFDEVIYRKLNVLQLSTEISANTLLAETIKRILALAFLPAEKIEAEYQRQKHAMGEPMRIVLHVFLQYFERYWLGVIRPKGFSVYGLSKRTNNCKEPFNRQLVHMLQNRPYPFYFMYKLLKIFVETRYALEQSRNYKFNSNLPKYQSQYNHADLVGAWLRFNDKDQNFTVEEFIINAAKLKGNIVERLNTIQNDGNEQPIESLETPAVVNHNIDYDETLSMTSKQRPDQRKYKREEKIRSSGNGQHAASIA